MPTVMLRAGGGLLQEVGLVATSCPRCSASYDPRGSYAARGIGIIFLGPFVPPAIFLWLSGGDTIEGMDANVLLLTLLVSYAVAGLLLFGLLRHRCKNCGAKFRMSEARSGSNKSSSPHFRGEPGMTNYNQQLDVADLLGEWLAQALQQMPPAGQGSEYNMGHVEYFKALLREMQASGKSENIDVIAARVARKFGFYTQNDELSKLPTTQREAGMLAAWGIVVGFASGTASGASAVMEMVSKVQGMRGNVRY